MTLQRLLQIQAALRDMRLAVDAWSRGEDWTKVPPQHEPEVLLARQKGQR